MQCSWHGDNLPATRLFLEGRPREAPLFLLHLTTSWSSSAFMIISHDLMAMHDPSRHALGHAMACRVPDSAIHGFVDRGTECEAHGGWAWVRKGWQQPS